MSNYRIETDSLGDIDVPNQALYGAQTQRAINNFPISGLKMPAHFSCSLTKIKRAAAISNNKRGVQERAFTNAMVEACDEII